MLLSNNKKFVWSCPTGLAKCPYRHTVSLPEPLRVWPRPPLLLSHLSTVASVGRSQGIVNLQLQFLPSTSIQHTQMVQEPIGTAKGYEPELGEILQQKSRGNVGMEADFVHPIPARSTQADTQHLQHVWGLPLQVPSPCNRPAVILAATLGLDFTWKKNLGVSRGHHRSEVHRRGEKSWR